MRSLLIAPADEKRLAEALASGADAVVVDLACAAAGERVAARATAAGFLKTRPRPPRRPGARRRGQRARFRRNRRRPRRGHGPCARRRHAARQLRSGERPAALGQACSAGGGFRPRGRARRKSSPSSTLRGRCWAWPAIASQAGGSPASPGAPPGCAPMSAPRATATMTAPTPAPFAWRATLRSWPRPPQGWRRLTPRSPTSPTLQACARKRSPPGATDFQPSSRSARSRRAS